MRYTHYSFMVQGFGRIPIVSWLRGQADESMLHAHEAGALITQLEGEPSLGVGPLLQTHSHDTRKILEEYATRLISDETRHAGEVRKMLLPPND